MPSFMQVHDEEALYWSVDGAITCWKHAPYPGSDTWNRELWAMMTQEELEAAKAQWPSVPCCEVCQRRDHRCKG